MLNPHEADIALDLTTNSCKRFAAWVASVLSRAAFSLEVRGVENLPANEPFILCANHSSHLDTFILVVATGKERDRLVFLGAHDYFFKHYWRREILQRLLCLIPFEREGTVSATQHNLRIMERCRDAGRIVAIYPEGTRSRDGRMGEFKPGVAFFSGRLGMRVVPCRIDGTFAAMPVTRTFPKFLPLRVTFGQPLSMPAANGKEAGSNRSKRYEAFAAQLRAEIEKLGEKPEPAAAATK